MNEKIIDVGLRVFYYSEDASKIFGFAIARLENGEKIRYTGMIIPSATDLYYYQDKIEVCRENLNNIISIENDYPKNYIKPKYDTLELERIKEIRDYSGLNTILSKDGENSSLAIIAKQTIKI